MQLNLVQDSSVASAPTGFMAAVQQAATIIDDTFTNSITVNISVGWGEIGGTALNTGEYGAEGGPANGSYQTYSTVVGLLQKNETSPAQVQAYSGLSTTPPAGIGYTHNGTTYLDVSGAQEKALGLIAGNDTALDGEIGFDSVSELNNQSGWVGVALHELTHAMGRVFENGSDIMDLFRYSAPNELQEGSAKSAYFSIDQGKTNLAQYSNVGDYGDFDGTILPNDPFSYSGRTQNTLTATDIELMNVLGFSTLNGLDYIASYGDLIRAYGANAAAGVAHYATYGYAEGRVVSFNGLDYIASYGDLIKAYGANEQAGAIHYITYGYYEGRHTTFNGLDYIASYGDLIKAYGANEQAGATHYINYGSTEGRQTTFNGLDYIASYSDLIKAYGANEQAGATSFINSGYAAGRKTTFDGLDYIASYGDLIKAYGANDQAGATHYITYGSNEHRSTTFDGLAYIALYGDLMHAYGANNDAGATHYINYGLSEGRSTSFNVAVYESQHTDLMGKYASNDAFLTAYINTYNSTGHFLT